MHRRRPRRGLTLFELLIVLAILGISASLVVLRLGAGTRVAADLPLARARRLAVARAEVLRLVVRTDGAWTVLAPNGTTLDTGTDGGVPLEVDVDALGNCQPVRRSLTAAGAFDPLACRYRPGGA